MKRITIILFMIASSIMPLFSQDLIELNDGKTIEAKVLEVGIKEVKYKLHSYETGPIYTILKRDIYSITYKNGNTELYGTIDNKQGSSTINHKEQKLLYVDYKYYINNEIAKRKDFENVLFENSDAYSLYQHGRMFRNSGALLTIVSTTAFSISLITWIGGVDIDTKYLFYFGVGYIVGGIINHLGNTQMSKAIQIYNNENNKTSLKFGIYGNGLGLAYCF